MTRIGTFEFSAPLWQYPGADGWHFVSVPAEISDDITDITDHIRRGFGSVRVTVTVGGTTWQTSIDIVTVPVSALGRSVASKCMI